MQRKQTRTTRYQLHQIYPPVAGEEASAIFHVTDNGGQSRDEVLRFYVIEARALLWEEIARKHPAWVRQDSWGFYSYQQYVTALVIALKYQWI